MKTAATLSPAKRALLSQWAKKGRADSASGASGAISSDPGRMGPQPLSHAQQRLWFLHQVDPGSTIYNVPAALRLTGALNTEALQHALQEVVRRHGTLRTRFIAMEGEPYQVVEPDLVLGMSCTDLSDMPPPQQDERVDWLVLQEASRPFDLERGPLIRASLLKLDASRHILLLTLHHIVCDGWSLGVLVREVTALYEASQTGHPAPLPDLPIQYTDFARWQRQWLSSEVLGNQLAHWRTALEDRPAPLALPTDRPRAAVQSFRGARLHFQLDSDTSTRLNALAQQHQCSLFMTVMTVFNILLARSSGQDDLCVGMPVANRSRAETEPLIGFFVNTLVLRTRLKQREPFSALLQRVRTASLAAFANQDLPFEYLVEALRPERSMRHSPLFQVMMAMQNTQAPSIQAAGLQIEHLPAIDVHSKFDFAMDVFEQDGRLAGFFEYNIDLFDESTMQGMADRFKRLLHAVVSDPNGAVGELTWSDPQEQARWLSRCNPPDHDAQAAEPVHRRIEARALERPHHPAVVLGDVVIDYATLNHWANDLALRLKAKGIRIEDQVGVYMERSPAMIAALLAIWKVGASYLPLDPAYPASRLGTMVEDAKPSLILISNQTAARVFHPGTPTLSIDVKPDQALASAAAQAPQNLTVDAPATAAAYVIYTSGSTGTPKGVVVSNHAIARHAHAGCERYAISCADRVLQFTSTSFDPSIEQTVCALTTGATLVLRGPDLWSTDQLLHEIQRHGITVANIPAALWSTLPEADTALSALPTLRLLIVGGEAIVANVIERLDARCALFNAYGPTETTVTASIFDMGTTPTSGGTGGYMPIGQPLSSMRMYILDHALQPVPPGVPGELYIAGSGVARGYLNQPGLTARSFLPDPFSQMGGRLYRSGDRARWLPDGSIEYLGRADRQIKLRGFRIEPGEVEAALLAQAQVREAAVMLREDDAGTPRLVAYAVTGHADDVASPGTALARTAQWRSTFNHINDRDFVADDPKFNIHGWNSTYDRAPIPASQMREWVDHTVERIVALRPGHLFEIGCGTGLLLHPLAAHCRSYQGTDLSDNVVAQLERNLQRSDYPDCDIRLSACPAHECTSVLQPDADTVVINSVAQYFPDLAYLHQVIESLISSRSSLRHIFLGDIRHHGLLEAFRTSVALHHATDDDQAAAVRREVAQSITIETELLIEPDYFHGLRSQFPRIAFVDIRPKVSCIGNEMTKYRYDVVITLNEAARGMAGSETVTPDWIDWCSLPHGIASLQTRLAQDRPFLLAVRDLPLPLIAADLHAQAVLNELPDDSAVQRARAACHDQADLPSIAAFDQLQALADEYGYQVQWGLAGQRADVMHALFSRHAVAVRWPAAPTGQRTLANQPASTDARHDLGKRLLDNLRARLPEHMVPSHLVLLDAMPMTPGGKLNRQALPAPDGKRGGGGFVAPRSDTERTLADIWAQVLQLDQVGVEDNFFSLGGHSLLCIKLCHHIEQRFHTSMQLGVVFNAPTVAALARLIDEGRGSTSMLLPLQDGPPGPPLFCVHPVGGQVFFYRALAQALQPHCSVVGVQSPEAALLPLQFNSLEAAADGMASAIRAHQPKGPYRLLGWSSGGSFAAAVAQSLEKQDAEVSYLGLVDCPSVQAMPSPDAALAAALVSAVSALRGRRLDEQELQQTAATLRAQGLSLADLMSRRHNPLAQARLHKLTGLEIDTATMDALRTQVSATQHHFALLTQSPRPRPHIAAHGYWAASTVEPGSPPQGDHPQQSITVLPGDHYSVMADGQVGALARRIAAHLESSTPGATPSLVHTAGAAATSSFTP